MKKIIRNRIKCNYCGDIIESKSTHDIHFCSCGKVGIDGGQYYLRRMFINSAKEDFTELSETEEVEEKE